MKTITKTVSINDSNVDALCTGYNVRLSQYGAAAVCERNTSPGYLTLKAAAKTSLFPVSIAKPYQLDVMFAGRITLGKVHLSLKVADTELAGESFWHTYAEEKWVRNLKNSTISSITPDSDIIFILQQDGRADVGRLHHAQINLLFYQYSCTADVSEAIPGFSANVSNTQPFQGESITFSANIPAGTTWDGWYSDSECTILVSKNINYTTSPNSDLSLYAKAIPPKPQTSFYMKQGGQWKEYSQAFKKEKGTWIEINFAQLKQELSNNKFTYK